jgi:MHS family alpha-ketoglutarate permease-like MFS transporter
MQTRKSVIKAIFSGSIGNLVEWYDWYTYAAFSLYFAPVFFSGKDNTLNLMQTAGIFAVGFLMRPLGGWFFGRLADRRGRKAAMTISVLLMSFGSAIIAVTPGYDHIGRWGAVLLLVARLMQGLSVGGEYGTAATYLSEMGTASRRGFYSSFQYVTLIGGQLLAVGVQLILQQWLLSPSQLQAWGWRIPFAIGAVLSLVAWYLRSQMEESEAFNQHRNPDARSRGSLRELFRYPRELAIVAGLTLGGTLAFYTYTTYMQKLLVNTLGYSKVQSTLLSFCSLFVYAFLQPVFGLLSDRIGRKPLLVGFGLLGTLGTIPLFHALKSSGSLTETFVWMMSGLLIVSGYTSINAVVKAELFPARIRALGVGFPYSVMVALFGGTAEYLALWWKQAGCEQGYYWYVSFCVFISLVVYLWMPETGHASLLDKNE